MTRKALRYDSIREAAADCLRHFVREATVHSRKISGPEDAAEFAVLTILAEGRQERENLGLICLNAANVVVHSEIVSIGTVNHAPAYPREIARRALLSNATAVILFHNHPGGQATPSPEDLQLTRHLADVLGHLGIQLHDHLIVAGNVIYSITAARTVEIAAPSRTLF